MNEKMMKNEVKYLREHLRDIHQYKSSKGDLTYDMSLELLSRCCIAFDYLQQELQRKDNIIKSLISYLETQINDYKEMGYNQSKIREKDLWMAGQYDEDIFILDKIKELETNRSDE